MNSSEFGRSYRKLCSSAPDEVSFQVVVEETDLHIAASSNLASQASELVYKARSIIKAQALTDPAFLGSLQPLPVPDAGHPLLVEMYRACAQFGVGPMAAVAGSVAEFVGRGLRCFSAEVIVENGGDLFIISERKRVVGVLPGCKEQPAIGLVVKAAAGPCSFCASSGKIGHSVSFGKGDLVVVRSKSGALADAAATSLANRLGSAQDVEAVVNLARSWEKRGLDGVFVQFDDQIGIWGDIEIAAD